MTVTVGRRTLLGILGFAPASAAIGSETLREPPVSGESVQVGNSCTKASMSEALRKMAAGIEDGTIEVCSININSDLEHNKIADHVMTIRFIYLPEKEV